MTIRLFAAVPVAPEIGVHLQRAQTGIAGARWRSLEALHVTLRFFGDIREDQAADVDAELAALAGEPFEMVLNGVGSFGEGREVKAVWAGVEESPPLRALAARCETAARRAGLKPVTRNYLPHVTLAYLSRPHPDEVARWIQANNLLRSEPFRVSWFSLFSSTLAPGGSRYAVERDYPLI